jgi:hypothetical protein
MPEMLEGSRESIQTTPGRPLPNTKYSHSPIRGDFKRYTPYFHGQLMRPYYAEYNTTEGKAYVIGPGLPAYGYFTHPASVEEYVELLNIAYSAGMTTSHQMYSTG